MIRRYHGTNITSANNIIGPPCNVDLTLGGGELGVGFYVGSSVALSGSRAKSKYKRNSAIIEFNILPKDYYSLSLLILYNRTSVRKFWNLLRKTRRTHSYQYGYDIIRAPFAVIYYSLQEKYESINGKNLLDNSFKRIV